jgi:hypothetical protein
MELSTDIRTLLFQRLKEWEEVLISRNEVYSTFSNPAGWRRHYCIFYPIEIKTVVVEFQKKYSTFVATYYFKQDHFITVNFKTEELALKCQEFFLRNTDLHQHQTIYQNGDWHVLDRNLVDKTDTSKKRYACDRYVTQKGKTLCVNDYNCRETPEISGKLKGNAFVAPLSSVLISNKKIETSRSSAEGNLVLKIYDYPDDSARSVTIIFYLKFQFHHLGEYSCAETEITFMETTDVSKYKKPLKTKLKKTLLPMLKSAVFHSKELLEKELGENPRDAEAFPETAMGLEALFDKVWGELAVEYC